MKGKPYSFGGALLCGLEEPDYPLEFKFLHALVKLLDVLHEIELSEHE